MDERQERQLRGKAIRLSWQGHRAGDILKKVSRSRAWLSKWRKRYQHFGWAGLRSHSRRPHRPGRQYAPRVRRLVVRAYHDLQKRKVGLHGVQAVPGELRKRRVLRHIPSLSTIKRILRQAGILPRHRRTEKDIYFPHPTPTARYRIQAMDWTERYLEGGAKVYAFHTIALDTRACTQTIRPDKTTATVIAHARKVWKTQGIPAALQMDNDAAFCGGYKAPRTFGKFVRLCLYVGIEPIFIPFGEAARNGDVEQVHPLWDKAIWRRRHFRSVAHVQRSTPEFERWYMRQYQPPKLQGQTPQQAEQHVERRRLTEPQGRALPDDFPISAGRVHFIRQVSETGEVEILNETWHVHKRLAGQYVWATIWTHDHKLEIYHRRSSECPARQVKTFRYDIAEPVKPLDPVFRHQARRRKMFTML